MTLERGRGRRGEGQDGNSIEIKGTNGVGCKQLLEEREEGKKQRERSKKGKISPGLAAEAGEVSEGLRAAGVGKAF